MTQTSAYASEDAAKFETFKPLIEAYNKDAVDQMQQFDPEFYTKCVAAVPSAEILDSEPIDATKFWSLLSSKEQAIVGDLAIADLTQKQLDGELTALEITKAYIKAAIIAQLTTNCVMQFLIPEALQRAQELDEYLKQNQKLVGPLHGVVVSLKEHMNYKNKITTASYVAYLKNVPENEAVTITILYKLGAVFHVRTAQPQGIMHLDTLNNITGRTRNPRSTRLSSGGSSGGESAVVAMHGSVIGHGSDIGGSIRAPAAFTDIFGIRPTTKRISLMNGLSSGKGQESIVAVQGPLARSIEELDTYMRAYINEGKPWLYDPMCLPIEWREPKLPAKIKIGVLYDDNLVTPFPAVSRGMKETVAKLSANPEFEIVNLNPKWFSEEEMIDIYTTNLRLYTCDGNKVQLSMWSPSGEPLLPLTKHYMNFGGGKELSIYENKLMNGQRDALRVEIFQKYFSHLDFILSPTYNGPAEIAGQSLYWGYTSFWNLADYPNVTFPVGVAHDVQKDAEVPNLRDNEYERMVWYNENNEIKYDPKNYIGGPVGLQLTGKRFCDEDVVAATKKIVSILGVERR
ncbi:LANO_0F13300g1_1 [Lachancea nothofagi CBS 11611]|uniref:amidase n=1 Tax=Lachancea nothofagi CBS 11611 TaxID=1266666 RepID=A0A1G4KBU6_9SACH|nr:LANO_0F13300g1_1 [Lachancea nothofagi CBS 11611]